MIQFLHMGGYWPYIWPAYGITALILLGLLIATLKTLLASERAVADLERDMPRRRRREIPADSEQDA